MRFTSPHPAEFTDDVIEAMAETPNVMPSLHMPLQSGSDRVLKAMRRSYRQSKYLGIIERVRAAMPDAAITTDIIVGFPGETEEDFLATLDVVRAARFSGAFTFQYSKRPGTPAADARRPGAARRGARTATSGWSSWSTRSPGRRTSALVGRTVELMVAEGEGRKDAATHRLSGRGPDNRLVHFAAVRRADGVRPGDLVTVEITYAAPHHLVADGPVLAVRRTRSGDAWEARTSGPGPGRGRARHARPRRARAAARRPRLRLRPLRPRSAGDSLQQLGHCDAREVHGGCPAGAVRPRGSVGAGVGLRVARLGRDALGVVLRVAAAAARAASSSSESTLGRGHVAGAVGAELARAGGAVALAADAHVAGRAVGPEAFGLESLTISSLGVLMPGPPPRGCSAPSPSPSCACPRAP